MLVMTFKRAPAALPAIPAALAACLGLALLSLAATQGVAAGFDRALLAFFAARRGPQADALSLAVTWLGSSFVLMPAAWLFLHERRSRWRWPAFVALG